VIFDMKQGDRLKLLPATLQDFVDIWMHPTYCGATGFTDDCQKYAQEDYDEHIRHLKYQGEGYEWKFYWIESEDPLVYQVSDDPGGDLEWQFEVPAKLVESI
jgi:hypothetical protein